MEINNYVQCQIKICSTTFFSIKKNLWKDLSKYKNKQTTEQSSVQRSNQLFVDRHVLNRIKTKSNDFFFCQCFTWLLVNVEGDKIVSIIVVFNDDDDDDDRSKDNI